MSEKAHDEMFAIEKCDEISVNDDRRRFFPKQQTRLCGRRRQSRLCQNDIIRVRKKKDSVVDGKSQSRTTLVNSTTGFASAIFDDGCVFWVVRRSKSVL